MGTEHFRPADFDVKTAIGVNGKARAFKAAIAETVDATPTVQIIAPAYQRDGSIDVMRLVVSLDDLAGALATMHGGAILDRLAAITSRRARAAINRQVAELDEIADEIGRRCAAGRAAP